MENNENKEVIRLTDEELKEVTGGAQCLPLTYNCSQHNAPWNCNKIPLCQWVNGGCVTKTSNS